MACTPGKKQTSRAAGIDLRAAECMEIPPRTSLEVAVEWLPSEDINFSFHPRSGLFAKHLVHARCFQRMPDGKNVVVMWNLHPTQTFSVMRKSRIAQIVVEKEQEPEPIFTRLIYPSEKEDGKELLPNSNDHQVLQLGPRNMRFTDVFEDGLPRDDVYAKVIPIYCQDYFSLFVFDGLIDPDFTGEIAFLAFKGCSPVKLNSAKPFAQLAYFEFDKDVCFDQKPVQLCRGANGFLSTGQL